MHSVNLNCRHVTVSSLGALAFIHSLSLFNSCFAVLHVASLANADSKFSSHETLHIRRLCNPRLLQVRTDLLKLSCKKFLANSKIITSLFQSHVFRSLVRNQLKVHFGFTNTSHNCLGCVLGNYFFKLKTISSICRQLEKLIEEKRNCLKISF